MSWQLKWGPCVSKGLNEAYGRYPINTAYAATDDDDDDDDSGGGGGGSGGSTLN